MLQVLLVDDEPIILEGMKALIDWKEEGYEIVECCSNGKLAYDYLQNHIVDVVISDIRMPVMDGITLMKKIREDLQSDAYIVILSGYNEFGYAQEAIRYGCSEYTLKPVTGEKLLEILRRIKKQCEASIRHGHKTSSAREESIKQSFRNFTPEEGEAERTARQRGGIFYKNLMDDILKATEENDHESITAALGRLYDTMEQDKTDARFMSMNFHYLLVQLIQLAYKESKDVCEDDLVNFIRHDAFETGTSWYSRQMLESFLFEYADYLGNLRSNSPHDVLSDVKRDISENYSQDLSLKQLAAKYYINSAYLGQLFRKQFGVSFRDYLNSIRVEEASKMLLESDDKILCIAERVGYHDIDYFIGKFIEQKGCTPATYRKRSRGRS
jgi:YesN/AraC family two-component response regulator